MRSVSRASKEARRQGGVGRLKVDKNKDWEAEPASWLLVDGGNKKKTRVVVG